jgi:hypothetical protein
MIGINTNKQQSYSKWSRVADNVTSDERGRQKTLQEGKGCQGGDNIDGRLLLAVAAKNGAWYR